MAKRKFNLTKEEKAKFKAAYHQTKDANLSKKLLAVRLYGSGHPTDDLLELVDCSRTSMMEWVQKYQSDGLDSLKVGSPNYLSPEQMQETNRHSDVGYRSDLFLLGILLYEMVTGKLPFEYPYQTIDPSYSPVLPSELISGLSQKLDQIIMKALAKNPTERFQSASAMRQALETVPCGVYWRGLPQITAPFFFFALLFAAAVYVVRPLPIILPPKTPTATLTVTATSRVTEIPTTTTATLAPLTPTMTPYSTVTRAPTRTPTGTPRPTAVPTTTPAHSPTPQP